MRIRANHIISFFVLLALFGLGETSAFTSSIVQRSTETEWVTKTSAKVKVSKSLHLEKWISATFRTLIISSFYLETINLYNKKLNIRFLQQIKVSQDLRPLTLSITNFHIPRLSIDDHKMSSLLADLTSVLCQFTRTACISGTILCYQNLNGQWLNQKRKTLAVPIYLNAFLNGFGNGHI
jgi:hypothetical protein